MTAFLLGSGSYLAIFVVLLLTGAGLPIPEEVPVIAAGIMASHGSLNPWLAFTACLAGAIAGDCLLYWIGRTFGDNLAREHPYWNRFVKPEREEKVKQMLDRHGLKVFFLTRFLIGLRSSAYLTAGVLRMPFRRFLLTDLSCATVVIGTFFLLSFHFGQTITRWVRGAELAITAVVVVLVAAMSIYLFRRWRIKHADKPAAPADSPPPGCHSWKKAAPVGSAKGSAVTPKREAS